MERNEYGVWTIKITDSAGKPAIPHNSRVKFRFMHNGTWIDRIPAWIKYATADPTSFAAPYDGVYWEPPPSERCRSSPFFDFVFRIGLSIIRNYSWPTLTRVPIFSFVILSWELVYQLSELTAAQVGQGHVHVLGTDAWKPNTSAHPYIQCYCKIFIWLKKKMFITWILVNKWIR